MGGRSDESEKTMPDRWAWVTELSDSRLLAYEKHAKIQYEKDMAAGHPTSHRPIESAPNLGGHIAKEKRRRGL